MHAPDLLPHITRRKLLRALLASAAAPILLPPFARTQSPLATTTQSPLAIPAFEELPADKTGIRFVHNAGKSAEKYLPESSGAGCAFIDYDNDGWMDLYFVNSGPSNFFTPKSPLRNALYKNNRDGTFSDVTLKAGVPGTGYGMGVAVGDYNGDGFPDLYVTQMGANVLYRNNGDGTFTDVTAQAGVACSGWSTSAVWFDYDNDGRLDLFVCQFAEFDLHHGCATDEKGIRHYCIPKIFNAMPSWLFHNNGDGTFADVSHKLGISQHLGKAWGVVAADFNNDGRMDLFVANDTVPNFLLINKGDRFDDSGLAADVAYSADGRARSGMGVDAADYDNDGRVDIFLGNIDEEFFSLYHNNGDGTFDDLAIAAGMGMSTRWMSGWGLKFLDFDNDGNLDLFAANGFPDDLFDQASNSIQWRQPLLLFHNEGGKFKDVSATSGPVFAKKFPARGLAIGDFNNDGGIDVLVLNNDEAPLILRNNLARLNNWLGIKLIGRKANIDAIGARVTYQSGDFKRIRFKVGGGSFLSAHDPRLVLGIGQRTKIDLLEIQWPQPSGLVERFTNLPINRYIAIVEGSGKWS